MDIEGEFSNEADFHYNYEYHVRQASYTVAQFIKDYKPEFGITLGSGMGYIANLIKDAKTLDYSQIPSFPVPQMPGHEGKLVVGRLEGVDVLCFKGRKHYYEMADEPFNNGIRKAVFPIHMLAELEVKNYFATNAAGGLNLDYCVGDIMLISSHINMIPNALLGRHLAFNRVDNGKPTERFQPMNEAYDPELRKLFLSAAKKYKDRVHEGVLLGVTGPTYETDAEGLFFRKGLGADAVGTSVTPEVIVARNRGMKAVAFSCITDVIEEDGTNTATHEQVVSVLHSPEVNQRFESIVRTFFRLYRETIQQPL
ncbi:MAG TPA: purine-nucleoside phosphorylase [Candidatus Nanoarchaeia archaeon]|nr:purine-nucleoside phosphorylase [Candidatus Nanoarchaeia archaeon]